MKADTSSRTTIRWCLCNSSNLTSLRGLGPQNQSRLLQVAKWSYFGHFSFIRDGSLSGVFFVTSLIIQTCNSTYESGGSGDQHKRNHTPKNDVDHDLRPTIGYFDVQLQRSIYVLPTCHISLTTAKWWIWKQPHFAAYSRLLNGTVSWCWLLKIGSSHFSTAIKTVLKWPFWSSPDRSTSTPKATCTVRRWRAETLTFASMLDTVPWFLRVLFAPCL